MPRSRRVATWGLVLLVLLAGCTGSAERGAPTSTGDTVAQVSRPVVTKRVVAAIKTVPPSLYQKLNPGNVSGGQETTDLVNAGLTMMGDAGALLPRLAEEVPTVENGLWKVLPDGRMEMIWKIKPSARWHDGAPFTADDLVFTARVVQDPDLVVFRDVVFDLIERVEAIDPHTALVTWKRPYIEADALFGWQLAVPMPRHLLERAFEEKSTFTDHPWFSQEFVGTGPFMLKQWVIGSHVALAANEQYVMGRPKVDEVEVRFITDDNTLISNLLAGTVDMTLGRGISMEQALHTAHQWREGRADFRSLDFLVELYPQFLNPTPAMVSNAQFRRALVYAIDRQQMVDSIQSGSVPIAHSIVSPNQGIYKDLESSVARYEYDPRRSGQLLEGLGYVRGSDGGFRDAGGQRLGVGIQVTSVVDIQMKSVFPVADFWQQVGVAVDVGGIL